jgi:hypothetical protein
MEFSRLVIEITIFFVIDDSDIIFLKFPEIYNRDDINFVMILMLHMYHRRTVDNIATKFKL